LASRHTPPSVNLPSRRPFRKFQNAAKIVVTCEMYALRMVKLRSAARVARFIRVGESSRHMIVHPPQSSHTTMIAVSPSTRSDPPHSQWPIPMMACVLDCRVIRGRPVGIPSSRKQVLALISLMICAFDPSITLSVQRCPVGSVATVSSYFPSAE